MPGCIVEQHGERIAAQIVDLPSVRLRVFTASASTIRRTGRNAAGNELLSGEVAGTTRNCITGRS